MVESIADSQTHPLSSALRERAPLVLPSLLLCDFGRLADEVARLEQAGVRALHLDVMDGHFVPNLSYGIPIVAAVRQLTNLPLDVHLMISNPSQFIRQFREAGADSMTIHIEAVPAPLPVLRQIREAGATAGLALNPSTPLSAVEPFLGEVDLVLVMSVNPGFGGQAFEQEALEKLEKLRSLDSDMLLEVDGGVNRHTIAACARAGANGFVAGSAIFGQPDYGAALRQLESLASAPSAVIR